MAPAPPVASAAILLRPAQARDVPALVRLLRRSWLVSWAPELPFEAVQAFAAADPARLHAESGWRGFTLAIRDAALVGMMEIEGDQLAQLHVDPACWNGGVGSRLLAAAEQRIGQAHAVMRLEVRGFNIRARAFYARHGWREVRRYPGTECGSPVENVEMRKTLYEPPATPA